MCSLETFKLKYGARLNKIQKKNFNILAELYSRGHLLSPDELTLLKQPKEIVCRHKKCNNLLWTIEGDKILKVWPYCNNKHMPQLLGVQAKKSTIENAGWGLFAAKTFDRLVPVVFYGGDTKTQVVEVANKSNYKAYEAQKAKQLEIDDIYAMELDSDLCDMKLFMNPHSWDNWPSRLINDNLKSVFDEEGYLLKSSCNMLIPHHIVPLNVKPVTKRHNICVHKKTSLGKTGVWLYSSKKIKKGEELFLSYGNSYW